MRKLMIVLRFASIVLFIGLAIPAYFFLRDNTISKQNSLVNKAKSDYYQREFISAYKTYELLVDSLKFDDDGARINYANAAFLSSNILKNGFYGSTQKTEPAVPDSVMKKLAALSTEKYLALTSSNSNKISSIASNQLGYSTIKSSFSDTAGDSVLTIALAHFKSALKSNPNNDSARYNYELIKKIVGYPETVMQQTRALIAQHRYIEAADLLEKSMERDLRLKKQQDFLKRIKAVAGIDTTYSRKL